MFWYGIDGQPISQQEANALIVDIDKRRVGLDHVETGKGTFEVSTVYLVLDHSLGGPVPMLFETMVFVATPGGSDGQVCLRWSTRQQAQDGHARLVAEITEQQGLPAWVTEGEL